MKRIRASNESAPGPTDNNHQRALDFEADRPRRRDEKALLTALTTALSVLVRAGDTDAALRQSFSHAIGGLDAEKGLVVQFADANPPELEIRIIDWLDTLPIHPDPVRGTLKTHPDFPAPGLQYPRDLVVWLPPSYTRTRSRGFTSPVPAANWCRFPPSPPSGRP